MLAVGDEQNLLLLAYTQRHRFDEQLERLQKRIGVQELIELGPKATAPDPLLQIRQELESYFEGKLERFETPFQLLGTEFQVAVWQQLCEIPYGETWSYAQLAASLGRPHSIAGGCESECDEPFIDHCPLPPCDCVGWFDCRLCRRR